MKLFCLICVISLTFLTACDKALDPSESKEVAVKGLYSAAISDNGEMAVIGSIYHGASLWRTHDQERLFNWNHIEGDASTIVTADFSDNNRWALTADPHTMVLWDTNTGRGERFWTAPAEILDAELNPQGTLALLGLDDHSAVVFDIQRGGVRRTLNHSNRVRSVDLSRDGRIALTGSEDFTAAAWDLQSGKQLSSFLHEDDVQLVELSDDGELALSVSKYDKAAIWKTQTGELHGELSLKAERLKRGLRFTAARFSEDGTLLLTGRPDRIVQLWDVQSLSEIQRWKVPKRDLWKPTSASINDIAFSKKSGEFVVASSNGFIHTLKLP